MYFLAQAMPIVPTAFYGLTLTSSGLNILNICHNYEPSIAFNLNSFFISQFSFIVCLLFTSPASQSSVFYLAFKVIFFYSTQPVILIANP